MTAKIGVLGQSTNTTQATHTVYTVPASKAAKVRLMWHCNAPNTSRLQIKVNGLVVFDDTAGASEFCASAGAIATPETSVVLPFQSTDPIAANPPTHVVRPLGVDFYLATGDIVDYTVSTADLTAMNIQVVGVEDDA